MWVFGWRFFCVYFRLVFGFCLLVGGCGVVLVLVWRTCGIVDENGLVVCRRWIYCYTLLLRLCWWVVLVYWFIIVLLFSVGFLFLVVCCVYSLV